MAGLEPAFSNMHLPVNATSAFCKGGWIILHGRYSPNYHLFVGRISANALNEHLTESKVTSVQEHLQNAASLAEIME